ncbi:MAG: NYN domain-containing protein [Anaerolineae bacterium]
MPFLIDGHNVIAALDDIDLEDPHDEAKLVMKLRTWAARVNKKAIVIFDGGIPGGLSRTLSTVDVRVVFAARHHTNADRIIRERLAALPDAPNWTVVSSDHEILDEARAHNARTWTAQEFADALERPPEADKEKPDAISAAEVEAWLEIFQEPDQASESTRGSPPSPGTPLEQRGHPTPRPRKTGRSTHPTPASTYTHTSPIGEQMGMAVPPEPQPSEPTVKPDEVSQAEVEAWLEVFHDDPNSSVPPPNLPKREAAPSPTGEPKAAVVRKQEGLSSSEVDAWLSVFEDEPASRPQAKANSATSEAPSTPPPKEETPRDSRGKQRTSSKLARHRERVAPAENETEANLSEEDLELWQRLFGKE